jgi:hypothetical protein
MTTTTHVHDKRADHKCSCGGSCAKCGAGKDRSSKRPDERRTSGRTRRSSSPLAFDFRHLRLHGTRPGDARCHEGESCPDDELVDYQGHGETTCNGATGSMSSTVTEHCAGDCVAQHEAVHRVDRGPCCTNLKKCLDNAGADATKKTACNDAFNTWFPKLSKWTECNAYGKEVTCLTSFIAANCGNPLGPGLTADCCRTLRTELTFATGERDTRCAGKVNEPCPIKADGTI